MKITKKLLSLSLLAVLMLCLCACNGIFMDSHDSELTALDASALGDVSLISCDSNEKYSVLLYINYTDEYDETTNEPVDDIHYYLFVKTSLSPRFENSVHSTKPAPAVCLHISKNSGLKDSPMVISRLSAKDTNAA